MNTEIDYSSFLEFKHIFELYKDIGVKIMNSRDISNLQYPKKPLTNSLNLLFKLGLLQYDNNDALKKPVTIKKSSDFRDIFHQSIVENIPDIRDIILSSNKHYDDKRNQFYILSSDVELKYMGMMMLLLQLNEFHQIDNRYYLSEATTNQIIKSSKSINIKELEKKLAKNRQLGEEAELFVLEYEKKKLKSADINKLPKRISEIDVSAGYDIASYLFDNSVPNKFIEVKNCDSSLSFYISKNELDVAKDKAENYFLYLYNRITKEIIEIQNPFNHLFKSDDWVYEIQELKFKMTSRN